MGRHARALVLIELNAFVAHLGNGAIDSHRAAVKVSALMIGLPVVSLGRDDLAEIRDVVYNPDAVRLQGFTLNKRARLDEVLDW